MSSSVVSVVEQALRVMQTRTHDFAAIVGPTASGKTALAIEIADRVGGEIVGADSVQIYRAFDIGSGKPTREELRRTPHHLVDTIDPMAHVDAATWAKHAAEAIADVRDRGRVPIVCGGTFLWVRALLFGLAPVPGASTELRARHQAIVQREGPRMLHTQLLGVDPEIAARLHPNDIVRVSRALEVHELTGRPMSAWQREHGFAFARHTASLLAIRCDGATLTDRIEGRARAWLSGGWIEEVQSLLERGYGDARAMNSVGYAQIRAMLDGRLSRADLLEAIVRATRVFARRQRTWLKRADVAWL
ncbi:MAG TPA: tRNA (adenosine(37)-N6)-dimethylallyltransferase MiaA [Polyangiaceae bacterium]|nr:tRNA (adenosine(37)-N6)-dimethylallyltransferase MiaA [Polyangiaceae bacterium]